VEPPPLGKVMARVAMPGPRVVPGQELAVEVAMTDLLLFDRAGRRVRFIDE
jgi:hypothetical protein